MTKTLYEKQLETNIEKLQELLKDTELGEAIKNLESKYVSKLDEVKRVAESVKKLFYELQEAFSGLDPEKLLSLLGELEFTRDRCIGLEERINKIETYLDADKKIMEALSVMKREAYSETIVIPQQHYKNLQINGNTLY